MSEASIVEPSLDYDRVRAARLVALAVGVNEYGPNSQLRSLQYAENDVDLIGGCLQQFGYYVISLKGTQANSDYVTGVFDRLRDCVDAEKLVFFFAGHGSQSGSEFATLHFQNWRPETKAGMLDTNHLTELARKLRIDQLFFIIDACRGAARGSGSRGSAAELGTDGRNMSFTGSRNERRFYRHFLMSCSDWQVSTEEPEWKNGVFTRILVKHLNERGNERPVANLYQEVADETAKWCAHKRYPEQGPTWGQEPTALFIGLDALDQQLKWAAKLGEYYEGRKKLIDLLEADPFSPALEGVLDKAVQACPDPVERRQLVELAALLRDNTRNQTRHNWQPAIDEITKRLRDERPVVHARIHARQLSDGLPAIDIAFENALALADRCLTSRDEPGASEMLERARILSQQDPDRRLRVELRRRMVEAFGKHRPRQQSYRGIEFVLIPAGKFRVGPPGLEKTIEIAKPFWISKAPICAEAWHNFDSRDRQLRRRPHYPVTDVPFEIARRFCERVLGGRLPGELEFECAARAMSDSRFPWGEEFSRDFANSGGAGVRSCGGPPNAFGLLDALGNVWEWCDSLFEPPQRLRTVRGGSWRTKPEELAVWLREGRDPAVAYPEVGFRCVRDSF